MTSNVAFVKPGEVVLKRCANPLYRDWLRRERFVLEALADSRLPIPRVLDFLDLHREVWLVVTRLPGRQATEVLFEAEEGEPRLALLRAVGVAVRRLHETPVPKRLRSEEPWIERQLSSAQVNLGWCDGSEELLEHLRTNRPTPVAPTLVHGDLNLENVLVEGAEVTGFIDWSGGDHGDPRCDVALALLSDDELQFDDEMLTAFHAGYGSETKTDERAWFENLYEFF